MNEIYALWDTVQLVYMIRYLVNNLTDLKAISVAKQKHKVDLKVHVTGEKRIYWTL